MAESAAQIQKLKLLGLTRTEAEVFLALRRESGGTPISAYKVAQSMGRDPANLGKTLAALEKQGAVRLTQDKPRLYLPVDPATFTEVRLARLQEVGENLVAELAQDQPELPPTGLCLALPGNEAAIEQTRRMLESAREQVFLFGSQEVVQHLADILATVAGQDQLSLRVICAGDGPLDESLSAVDLSLVPMNAGLSRFCPQPFLQLMVDNRLWLQALFNRPEADPAPCGWWVDDPGMAGVAAALFHQCWTLKQAPEWPGAIPAPDADEKSSQPDSPAYQAGVLGSVQAGSSAPSAHGGAFPAPPPEPAADSQTQEEDQSQDEDEDDGFQFIVKHD